MNHIRSFGNHNAVVFVRCHFRHCFLRTGTYSYWRWWLISTPLPSVTASHVFLKKLQCKMHEHYKPSKAKNTTDKMALRLVAYAGSDLNFSSAEWTANIVGKVSERIDLDSRDDHLRMDSETLLNQQIDWASYLSIEACLLPAPKGNSCANYARCVNQILPRLKNMKLWLRIPLGTSDDDYSPSSAASVDSWQTWNSFRLLCDHPSAVLVALDVKSALPSENSLKRWFGEPITVAILESDIFLTKARGNTKYLPKRHQKLITDLFDHSLQVILSGTKAHSASGSQTQPLGPCLEHVSNLFKQMEPISELESAQFCTRDYLPPPLLPYKNYSQAHCYARFEEDVQKYLEYSKAVSKALLDRVPDEEASVITTVLVVVGAGRGPLVVASLRAAKNIGRKIRVYAVEKNPRTAIALDEVIKWEGSSDIVSIVTSDVRCWAAPEKADILVSDLFGSFGDNELSPESLDGAQRFLNKGGISIPASYTSFLQPLTASQLYTNIKDRKNIVHPETAFSVNLHNVAPLSPCQQVFTFVHPKCDDNESNERYKKLRFVIPMDIQSAMVHGFAGYFDAILYKDVCLHTEPSRATPNVQLSWFPMFFPLKNPILVNPGSTLEVHFWRCVDSRKVWYEWCVTSPSVSLIHNVNGRACSMEL